MSALQRAIVDEARTWIGTPYRHQFSVKGQGCDCLGLLRGVWRSVIGPEPETAPAYTPDWSEASGEERLWQAAKRHLQPIRSPVSGDILLFRMRSRAVAKHLGILASNDTRYPTIIHAYTGHGVVETPLTQAWSRRVVAGFRFPIGGSF